MFYDTDTKEIYERSFDSTKPTYAATLPAGKYLSFFKPTSGNTLAFTNKSDHTLLIEDLQNGERAGAINICDSEYPKTGLPSKLK